MKKHTHDGKYISWAVSFIIFIILVVLGSLIWRLVGVIKASTFDPKHQFIISATTTTNEPLIAVLSPDLHKATIIKIQGSTKDQFGILHDAVVQNPQPEQSDPQHFLQAITTHISSVQTTWIDKLRIGWFVKSLSSDAISVTTVEVPEDVDQLSKILAKSLTDAPIYQESQTITVINASGIAGLGSKLGAELNEIGANVIAVRTADTTQDHSTIQYNKISYTLERITKLTQIQSVQQVSGGISDITVIIGRDKIVSLSH